MKQNVMDSVVEGLMSITYKNPQIDTLDMMSSHVYILHITGSL